MSCDLYLMLIYIRYLYDSPRFYADRGNYLFPNSGLDLFLNPSTTYITARYDYWWEIVFKTNQMALDKTHIFVWNRLGTLNPQNSLFLKNKCMSGIERKNFLNIQFFLALNGTSVTVSYPCSISIWGDFSFSRKEEKNLNWSEQKKNNL